VTRTSDGGEDGGTLRVGVRRRVCFPLDAKRKRQGSTAWNVSGARTHKKNGRQNPRASYFTVCQAVRGFYNITDKHLAKKNCAHQNGSAASIPPSPLILLYNIYVCSTHTHTHTHIHIHIYIYIYLHHHRCSHPPFPSNSFVPIIVYEITVDFCFLQMALVSVLAIGPISTISSTVGWQRRHLGKPLK